MRKTIDRLIATFCLREGHSLLHRDRDFDPLKRSSASRCIHPTPGGLPNPADPSAARGSPSGAQAICSYDADLDVIAGLRRLEPPALR